MVHNTTGRYETPFDIEVGSQIVTAVDRVLEVIQIVLRLTK